MIYDWYNIFNLNEFSISNLVSKRIIADLEGRGETEFLIVQGDETSIFYDGVLLPVWFLNINPFARQGYAVYIDDNGDVWFGFET